MVEKDKDQIRPIYIDILNFSDQFLDFNDHWFISNTEKNIDEFIKLLIENNFHPYIFIDLAYITKEVIDIYKERREKELQGPFSETYFPGCGPQLLFELFSAKNIECHFSFEADNDDTLAAYASNDTRHTYLLSRDRDFYRYINTNYYQVTSWSVIKQRKKNKLKNVIIFENKHRYKKEKQGKDEKKLLNPLPKTTKNAWTARLRMVKEHEYILLRGNTSNHDKRFGNGHLKVRELRQALYFNLGMTIEDTVTEVIPSWDDIRREVKWSHDKVKPDGKLKELLFDPEKAFIHFFSEYNEKPKDIGTLDWNNFLFNMKILIFEICANAMNVTVVSLIKKDKLCH